MDLLHQTKLSVLLLICLMSIPCVLSLTQYIDVANETLAITPQFTLEDITPNTSLTTVFKIYRSNYSQESQLLAFNYTAVWNNISVDVHKEINQYTSAHTGQVEGVKQNNTLLCIWENKTLQWNFTQAQENQTNTSINQTNSTVPAPHESTANNTPIFSLSVSRQIFKVGQTLFMNFSVDPQPSNFTITYWIELLNGSIVKAPYTTTNLQTKQHTFRQPDFPQQPVVLHARYEDKDHFFHKTVLLAVYLNDSLNQVQENSDSVDVLQTAFEIEDVVVKDNIVSFAATLVKGESRSRIITLNLRDQQGYRLADEQKISLPNDNTQVRLETNFISDTVPAQATIDIEGLHETLHHQVHIPSVDQETADEEPVLETKNTSVQEFEPIASMYTRHSYFQEDLGWYIRLRDQGDFIVSIASSHNQSTYNISQQKTTTHHFTVWPAEYNDTIKVKVCSQGRCVEEEQRLNLSVRSSSSSYQAPQLSHNISPLTARVADNTTSIHLHATSAQKQSSYLRITALIGGICVLLGAGSYLLRKRFKKK